MAKRATQTELFNAVRKMDWSLSTDLVHFKDGTESVHLRKLRVEPFQVVTIHLEDMTLDELTSLSPLRRFRLAMSQGSGCDQAAAMLRTGE